MRGLDGVTLGNVSWFMSRSGTKNYKIMLVNIVELTIIIFVYLFNRFVR